MVPDELNYMAAPTNYFFVTTSSDANRNDSNDGRDILGFNIDAGTFTQADNKLTQGTKFAGYSFAAGDRIYISGGTGVTTGLYDIAAEGDDDHIVLSEDIGGTNPADVTSSTGAWATLGKADTIRTAGDVIFLAQMIPDEEFDITSVITLAENGTAASPIVWSGSNSQGIVDGTVVGISYTGADVAEGALTITGTQLVFQYILVKGSQTNNIPPATFGMGWSADAGNVVFYRCEATDNEGDGFAMIGGDSYGFLECYAANNGTNGNNADVLTDQGAGFTTRPDSGERMGNESEAVFFGCVAKDNENLGIYSPTGIAYQCILYHSGSGVFKHHFGGIRARRVMNCTIYNNAGDGIEREETVGPSVFLNNIIIDNSAFGIDTESPLVPTLILNNGFHNNTSGNLDESFLKHLTDLDGNPIMEQNTSLLGGDPFLDTSIDNFDINIKTSAGLLCVHSGSPRDFIGTTATTSLDRGASFVEFIRHGTG